MKVSVLVFRNSRAALLSAGRPGSRREIRAGEDVVIRLFRDADRVPAEHVSKTKGVVMDRNRKRALGAAGAGALAVVVALGIASTADAAASTLHAAAAEQ